MGKQSGLAVRHAAQLLLGPPSMAAQAFELACCPTGQFAVDVAGGPAFSKSVSRGILVDKDVSLLNLSRYVVLNPDRAGMVESPSQWPRSSYRVMIGEAPAPAWLAVDGLPYQFGAVREEARRGCQTFVLEGVGQGI